MADTIKLENRIGEVVREVVFPIEAGKIAEFARAMRDDNPAFVQPAKAEALGHAPVPAPLTFSVASAHYAGGNATDLPIKLGLDLSRTVHGEQRWIYHRPIEAGQTLTGITRIAQVDRKASRGGEMLRVTTETVYRDSDGRPVVTESMLSIELPPK